MQETPHFDHVFVVFRVLGSLLTGSVNSGMTSSQYARLNVFCRGELTKRRSKIPHEQKRRNDCR
jgi:hypothetical protein